MSLRRIVFFALLIAGGWWMFAPAPKAHWTGRAAPEEPIQTKTNLPSPWSRGDYTFTALARFEVRGVVLSRCNYSGGHEGELCPTDFALGWGVMSDAAVINGIKLWQDHRWVSTEWRGRPPAPHAEIERSMSNMHLIPATDDVRQILARVKRHELLEISGCLVEVRRAEGWRWSSSVSRGDTGGGACEVVWVERAERAPIPVAGK
jgi:hypothetical protein